MVFFFVLASRIVELIIARENERWMKKRGAIEIGGEHYKWFIFVHSLFFISLLIEVISMNHIKMIPFNTMLFMIFLLAQGGRVWCIYSLGRFWNTKIIVLPKVSLIKKGPYKYVRHPNYIIVFIELLVIPLMFQAYITALLFPFFHLILLTIRLPEEERALRQHLH